MKRLIWTANTGQSINASRTDKSFLVLFQRGTESALFEKRSKKFYPFLFVQAVGFTESLY
jgi:hypothetical protein